MNNLGKSHDLKNYLTMGQHGHYPLFFKEWLNDEEKKSSLVSYKDASKTVKSVFKNLSRHRTIDKMQTAIISMDNKDRDVFINSFLKMVEYNSLKEISILQ